jgi:hypothetical protein
MAPSEETTSAACSEQQEQDVAGAKLQQDSPRVQEHASATRDENIDLSVSPNAIGNVETVADSVKSVATSCAENIVSLIQRPDSDGVTCVENINPHVNNLKSLSDNSVVTADSAVDSTKNVCPTWEEGLEHFLNSSECVGNDGEVVESPNISAAFTGNIGQHEDSPKSVLSTSIRNNDHIPDGPKKVASKCLEYIEQDVANSKSVTATNLSNIHQVAECPASVDSVVIGKEEKVVDNPKCVASACVDIASEGTDNPKNEGVSDSTTTLVENVACAVSVSKDRVANVSMDNASPVTPATKVDCSEAGTKGKDILFLYFPRFFKMCMLERFEMAVL